MCTLLLGQRTHISHVHRPRYWFHILYGFGAIESDIIPKNFWSGTYKEIRRDHEGMVAGNYGKAGKELRQSTPSAPRRDLLCALVGLGGERVARHPAGLGPRCDDFGGVNK